MSLSKPVSVSFCTHVKPEQIASYTIYRLRFVEN